jgi:hypothetical protein
MTFLRARRPGDFDRASVWVRRRLRGGSRPACAGRSGRARDPNRRAELIVDIATGETKEETEEGKNPAAVELGPKGGLISGKVRAEGMTATQRARRAAEARWSKP